MMKNQLAGLMKQAQAMQDNMRRAQEELAAVSMAFASSVGIDFDITTPYIVRLGTEEAKQQWLPAIAAGEAVAAPTLQAQVRAAALCDLIRGRLQRYARTGFRRLPSEQLDATLALLL